MPVHDGQWTPGSTPDPAGPVFMEIPSHSSSAGAAAGAELARRTAEFRAVPPAAAVGLDPRAAALRLAGLTGDKGWSDQLLAGDAATVREFHALTELASKANAARDALDGFQLPPQEIQVLVNGELPASAMRAAVDSMRNTGMSDAAITEMFDDTPVTSAERFATLSHQRSRLADPEWVKRYLAGGWIEAKEAALHAQILNRPVKD